MAEPLVIQFAADTSRAQSAMASLTAQVVGNMTQIGVAMAGGAANANGFGAALEGMKANAVRTATAVGADVKAIAGATGAAVAAEGATLQSVASAFTAAAVTSNTATASARAGVAATATALGTVSAQLPALGQLAVALGVAGGAYLTISTAVSAANAQIARFTALSAEAERTGFGIGILQRFQDVAKEAGLAVEEIDHALRHAAQATTPRFEQDNPVRKQLTDLFQSGYTGDFQSKGLADYLGARDAETRLRAVVTALRELRDLGLSLAAVDLAEKVFGADTAERIRTGRLDIEAIADALDRKRDDLITQEQVDRAVDFRDRLDAAYAAIAKVLETSLAVTEAGYAIDRAWLAVVETTARAAVNAGQFLDAMLKAARAGDGQSPLAPRQRLPGEGSLGADLGEIAGQSARGRTLYDRPIGPERPAEFITDPPEPPRRPLSFFTEQAHARPAHPRDGGAGAAADPLETFVHGLEKSAAAAKAEAEAFDRSDAEKNVAVQLARAQEIASQNGRSLTEAETQAVTRAAHAVAQYRDQLADLEQQQRQGAETARFFGDTVANSLADAIVNGRTFADILRGVQAQLGRAALQAVFTGQGPLAGPFGTAPAASAPAGGNAVGGLAGLFGGGFSLAGFDPLPAHFAANGGPVQAGQPVTVGEMGREVFVPQQNGTMFPLAKGPGWGAAAGPIALTVDVSGARGNQEIMSMVHAGVAAGMAQTEQRIGRSINGIVANGRRRYARA
ncbi:hypothetical protein [Methylobacterium persicinum]|uniref:Bacteriophage tail tape measure C-terminal domain-containing protein n=1 Tax=Methylobacterium persicinum TaxID=374426 RepID=A0ABU0HSJ7_9HYPH|nr:hypothetical protein [Methylobacterium persicinum]MDQ0444670.1 hypothetical protein [Methylobacterium persicinum]GJE38552.1 hypothetical protein KHHGKMAE_2625 [Methylobacterium persicinum]